ncbi:MULTISPECIES: S41 family peptidase [unclassified Lentimicrobium]|uniref:S41 family peptidase n=1 Tax=unclassified Lentimicrobium TaxID=2677434 RepID=UPI0015527325|nr:MULTISPECIES: S41 family peptidase [unclassified Lentimicrobium]NPD46602.1 PDZ domain-containing protein [Lentimicrobium sp. S6]NPD83821.1 PDZ domain-containing protein [Lentimicrobium sp. L6]
MKKWSLLALLFITTFTFAQSSLLRFPALDPSGENIAFTYQGDIWVMNLKNEIPVRISIHEAYDAYPTWSPDGNQIAFSSNRYGSEDVFVINKNGSGLKRLTFHPSNDKVNSWAIADRIVFETRRISAQVERDQEIFYVSPEGGNPTKLMEALGSNAIESPDGKQVAFVRGSCRIARQAYQGSANRDIWIFNKKDKSYTQITAENYNEFYPIWENDESLFYISSNGAQIYQLNHIFLPTMKIETKTSFKDFGLRYFSYAPEKKLLALESGNHIYLQESNSTKAMALNLKMDFENRKNNIKHETFTGEVNAYQVSPNGKYLASSIKGNIFITQAKDKDNFTKTLSNDSFINSDPVWLNDTCLLFISNRNGVNEVFSLASSDEKEVNLFKSLKHEIKKVISAEEDINKLVLSNEKTKVAYLIGDGQLVVADINEKGSTKNEITLLDTWAEPSGVCWSPDDQYLAYSKSDLDFNREIYIHKADNSMAPVNVSMHPRTDASPSWSPDGKKLAFSSIRNYGNYDIWYVWLQKKDYEKTMTEWKLEDSEDDDKKKDEDKVEVKIDFDQIYNRLFQLTSLPGNEGSPIFSEDSDFIYFTSNSNEDGKTDLYKIRWDKKEVKAITQKGKAGRGMQLSPDGKYLYLLNKGGKPGRLKLTGDKMENIPVKAVVDVDLQAQRAQVFEQGWKAINQGFYDPKFHRRDWNQIKDIYQSIALSASTDEDFREIFNWMLGEINASHMGLYGPRSKEKKAESAALLGIEFSSNNNGIQIDRILKGSPADKEESQLMPGDIITAINQEELSEESNLYEILANKTNQATILNVDREGNDKEIVIRPTSDLNTEKYNDWVEFNRNLVDELSNGELGYLHIKAMGWPSFELFERDLMAAGYGKKGILIDVRYNGGGWTTDYLMAVLTVKQHAYTVPRGATKDLEKEHKNFREHYAFGERLPFASWTKPSIALCNQNSYSNAEIFSHAYKSNNLGTLVGTPTFGAVISTGGKGLIDGGYIRLPFRGWYVKESDANMELVPATPDIIVDIKPDSRANGKDEQLEKAVEILLEQIQ